jgi:hypothetical protein
MDNNKIHQLIMCAGTTSLAPERREVWNNSRDEEKDYRWKRWGEDGTIKQFIDESQMELVICKKKREKSFRERFHEATK